MKATIKTKSNFRNLNGTQQEIKEIAGNRVTCTVYSPEHGKNITIDFTIDEVSIDK